MLFDPPPPARTLWLFVLFLFLMFGGCFGVHHLGLIFFGCLKGFVPWKVLLAPPEASWLLLAPPGSS